MCQTADTELLDIKEKIEVEDVSRDVETLSNYEVEDGLLYRRLNGKLLFVMPKAMRKSLVVNAHNVNGYPTVDKTITNIRQDFWFADMERYVRFYIRTLDTGHKGWRDYLNTAQVYQLKSQRLLFEENDQVTNHDQMIVSGNGNKEAEGSDDWKESRPKRLRRPPICAKDYEYLLKM